MNIFMVKASTASLIRILKIVLKVDLHTVTAGNIIFIYIGYNETWPWANFTELLCVKEYMEDIVKIMYERPLVRIFFYVYMEG